MNDVMSSFVGLAAMVASSAIIAVFSVSTADPINDGQWYVKSLEIVNANKISQGVGVKVGVIDTGVDPRHPDLLGSVDVGADFTKPTGGDGLSDLDGHGTSVASLIAGHGRIHGVAPRSTVVSLKVGDGFWGSSTATGQALRWAVEHKIGVVVIAAGYNQDDLYLRQAIQFALSNDVVIVAAAGNKPDDVQVPFPAAYQGVLAVGGIDRKGDQSAISVAGNAVALVAPSDLISTADHNLQRALRTGTSCSAALVAGAVALIRSQHPELSASEVIRRLTSTATDKGSPGRDREYGYGIVNLIAALSVVEAVTPSSGPDPQPSSQLSSLTEPGRASLPTWLKGTLVLTALCLITLLYRRLARSSREF